MHLDNNWTHKYTNVRGMWHVDKYFIHEYVGTYVLYMVCAHATYFNRSALSLFREIMLCKDRVWDVYFFKLKLSETAVVNIRGMRRAAFAIRQFRRPP